MQILCSESSLFSLPSIKKVGCSSPGLGGLGLGEQAGGVEGLAVAQDGVESGEQLAHDGEAGLIDLS